MWMDARSVLEQQSADWRLRDSSYRCPHRRDRLQLSAWIKSAQFTRRQRETRMHSLSLTTAQKQSSDVQQKPDAQSKHSGSWKQVCNIFGPPEKLITDNGTEFCNTAVAELISDYRINHVRTSSFHPQSNGQTERFKRYHVLNNQKIHRQVASLIGMCSCLTQFTLIIHRSTSRQE